MNGLKYSIYFLGLLFACSSPSTENSEDAEVEGSEVRIVSLGGAITEVLFDLGLGDQIVGVDITSVYPEAATQIPKLGHVSQLNAEAILGLNPSIIFAEDEPGAKKSLESLSESGLPIEFVPSSENLDRAYKLGKFIGQKLEVPEGKVEEIYKKIEKDSLNLVEVLEGTEGKPSVLFLYARGTERLMVAGKNTSADAVIGYAGGVNAVQAFDGFKILSPETLVESQPEIILMFKTGLASLDGKEGLSKLPGIAETPAMKNDRIIAMDGYFLLGFGPRQAEAVVELAQKIHKQKVTAYLDH